MQQRYFYNAFAVNGDQTQVPMATDSSGLVSYNIGYGPDYELDLATDSNAIALARAKFNSVLYDVTLNLQNYQQWGFPEFISSSDNQGAAYPYAQYAICRYKLGSGPSTPFMSLVNNNTSGVPTEGANWSRVANINDVYNETVRAVAAENNETARAEAVENNLNATKVGFASFNHGSNVNGFWRESADGFIEQWGVVGSDSSGAATVTLPIEFNTLNHYAIDLTIAGSGNNGDTVQIAGTPNSSSFVISTSATPTSNVPGGPVTVYWSARGY